MKLAGFYNLELVFIILGGIFFIANSQPLMAAPITSVKLNNGIDKLTIGSDLTSQAEGLNDEISGAYRWFTDKNFMLLNIPFEPDNAQRDYSGNGNSAWHNGAYITSGCKIGGCIDLKQNRVIINPGYSFHLRSPSATFEFWVKVFEAESKYDFEEVYFSQIAQQDFSNQSCFAHNGFIIGLNLKIARIRVDSHAGKVVFFVAGGTLRPVVSNKRIDDGRWHYLAATYDGNQANIYIDGVLDATGYGTAVLYPGPKAPNPVIGMSTSFLCYPGASTTYDRVGPTAKSLVDELKIYPKVLTKDQINQNFQDGNQGKGYPTVIKNSELKLGEVWNLEVTGINRTDKNDRTLVKSSNSVEIVKAVPKIASPFNTRGWAWNDNLGWISHNSVDDPVVKNVYGVNLNEETGFIDGHAYNEIFGWIDFSPAGPYPAEGPNAAARYDRSTQKLSGWAKILGFGDNGWIKLRDEGRCGGCPYGVSLQNNQLVGMAWSDTIGWVVFNPAYGGVSYQKSASPSLSGWAWNDGYGWISFRYTNHDIEYGINLENDGRLTGYAWSENLGWIQYNPAGPFPSSPNQPVKWDLITKELSGWAKAISLGEKGWISFGSKSGDNINYQSKITYEPGSNKHGQWSGYAWNDLFGWIDFNHGYKEQLVTTLFSASGGGIATPILETPVTDKTASSCVDTITIKPTAPMEPTLVWSKYAALDGSSQQNYQLQIDNDVDFSSPIFDLTPGTQPNTSNSYAIGTGLLEYGKSYYWRVRVQHATSKIWSEWGTKGINQELGCFKTPAHQPPLCDFNAEPNPPMLNNLAKFNNLTKFYGQAKADKWEWDFGDGVILNQSKPDSYSPTHVYADAGSKSVKLTVTDSDGYRCSKILNFQIKKGLPKIRRIVPRF